MAGLHVSAPLLQVLNLQKWQTAQCGYFIVLLICQVASLSSAFQQETANPIETTCKEQSWLILKEVALYLAMRVP